MRAFTLRKTFPVTEEGFDELPVSTQDIEQALRDDPVKLKRFQQTLENWDALDSMLRAF